MSDKAHCDRCDRTLAVDETSIEIRRGKNTYRATLHQCENCFSWFMRAVVVDFPNINIHGPGETDGKPKPKAKELPAEGNKSRNGIQRPIPRVEEG